MKKLKQPFRFEIGKCYRVRAFEFQALYRIQVEKLWNDGAPDGLYRYYNKATKRYSGVCSGGSFSLISEAHEIPSL